MKNVTNTEMPAYHASAAGRLVPQLALPRRGSFWLGHEARTKDYLNNDRVRTFIEDARDQQRTQMRQLLTLHVLEVWLRARVVWQPSMRKRI